MERSSLLDRLGEGNASLALCNPTECLFLSFAYISARPAFQADEAKFGINSIRYLMTRKITIGVLALQGAFYEHIQLLKSASIELISITDVKWDFIEVRTPSELAKCDALIIPGGESTTVSLVAERSNLLEPLREFVKYVCALQC